MVYMRLELRIVPEEGNASLEPVLRAAEALAELVDVESVGLNLCDDEGGLFYRGQVAAVQVVRERELVEVSGARVMDKGGDVGPLEDAGGAEAAAACEQLVAVRLGFDVYRVDEADALDVLRERVKVGVREVVAAGAGLGEVDFVDRNGENLCVVGH